MTATQTMPVTTVEYPTTKSPTYVYNETTSQPLYSKNTVSHGRRDTNDYTPSVMNRSQLPPLNLSNVNNRTSLHLMDRHSRQIRSPQSPMYVPAVLRPTEKPQRQSPPKKGEANPNKWDWARGEEPTEEDNSAAIIATEDIHDEDLGPVTGPPSREHWMLDQLVSTCFASCCQRSFGFLIRKHHCRRCGNIYCYEHIRNQAPLNQHALFHLEGQQSKICDRCCSAYKRWHNRRLSRSNSEDSTATASPAISCNANLRAAAATTSTNNVTVGSVAGSVGGYHWSTF